MVEIDSEFSRINLLESGKLEDEGDEEITLNVDLGKIVGVGDEWHPIMRPAKEIFVLSSAVNCSGESRQ
jgi:hypothetical protein